MIVVCSCATLPQSAGTASAGYPERIRIGIIRSADKVSVRVPPGTEVRVVSPGSEGVVQRFSEETLFDLSVVSSSIEARGFFSGTELVFYSVQGSGAISVNGRPYRGSIVASLSSRGNMNIINDILLEEYLCGIMKAEISPDWPAEAIRAQAVVSRTYAVKNMGKYSQDGFDLSCDTDCQVYIGVEGESGPTNLAVEYTGGEVITYRGELIKSFFHSNSGGYTEDVSKVWGMSGPVPVYLRGRPSPYCRNSPNYSWEYGISLDDVERLLNSSGLDIGRLEDIRVHSRTRSGRAELIALFHGGGKTLLQSNRFRMIVGSDKVKSTLLSISREGRNLKFSGRGWGHGVGMSQWGAREMARRGYSYRDIIKFYFPGTRIDRRKPA